MPTLFGAYLAKARCPSKGVFYFMNAEQIIDIATLNYFDVRQITDVHYRLMDTYGNYIFDVYIKHGKNGVIKYNSVLKWTNQSWYRIRSVDELKKLF